MGVPPSHTRGVYANEKFGVFFTPSHSTLTGNFVPPVRARRESGRNLASETQDPCLLSSLSFDLSGSLGGGGGGKAEFPLGEPLRRLCAFP